LTTATVFVTILVLAENTKGTKAMEVKKIKTTKEERELVKEYKQAVAMGDMERAFEINVKIIQMNVARQVGAWGQN
jgi:flagellar basal body rod protein FlgF